MGLESGETKGGVEGPFGPFGPHGGGMMRPIVQRQERDATYCGAKGQF